MWRMLVIIFLISAVPSKLAGSQTDVPDSSKIMKRLLLAKSLKCTFGPGHVAEWDTGGVKVKQSRFGDTPLHFDSIDPKGQHARLIGGLGAGDVKVWVTGGAGLTFIELTPIGNLVFTSVFASYDKNGDFTAVMSRHMGSMLSGPYPPFPSQYYGSCKIWH